MLTLRTFKQRISTFSSLVQVRNFSSTAHLFKDEKNDTDDVQSAATRDWWFNRIRSAPKLDTPTKPQSNLLSDMESVYEIQFHKMKPECMASYLEASAEFVELMNKKQTGAELMGSFTVMIGDQDEAVHLWKYKGGYPTFNKAMMIYRTDPEIIDYRVRRNGMLRSRFNQILLRFAFWEFKTDREPGNIYEMRSYVLKPGAVIEWGNHWMRGLKYRQDNNAAVCGFFSHIGQLNMTHHLWAYKDLQQRKVTRDIAWSRPGWDENVRYTVTGYFANTVTGSPMLLVQLGYNFNQAEVVAQLQSLVEAELRENSSAADAGAEDKNTHSNSFLTFTINSTITANPLQGVSSRELVLQCLVLLVKFTRGWIVSVNYTPNRDSNMFTRISI